jgi:hypothetical protein
MRRLVGSMLIGGGVSLAFYPWLAIIIDCFTKPFSPAIVLTFIFALLPMAMLGRFLIRLGRGFGQSSAMARLSADHRPPVVLLRPFSTDREKVHEFWLSQKALMRWVVGKETYEERLAAIMDNVGPTIALGSDGDLFPLSGFARHYVSKDSWKTAVKDHLARAGWAVILLHRFTPSLLFELTEALTARANLSILLIPLPARERTPDWHARYRNLVERGLPEIAPETAAVVMDHDEVRYVTAIRGDARSQLAAIQNAFLPIIPGAPSFDSWAEGESIVRTSGAILVKEHLLIAGRLYLTNQRLRFCAHRLNIDVVDYSFGGKGLSTVHPYKWLSYGFRVAMKDGRRVDFVVFNAKKWISALTGKNAPPRP